MSTGQIVGLALVCAGIFDLVLGLLVVGPRIPDESRRRIVQIALTLAAVGLVAIGTAFLTGALGLGGAPAPEA